MWKCCHRNTNRKKEVPLGVSVFWLQHGLLDVEVKNAGLTDSSLIYELENLSSDQLGVIRRKGQYTICPHDGRLGAAYVDCLSGKSNVGYATFMLSYGWGNSIGDIVNALVDYCNRYNLNQKRTYVWICCLCNNQHRVAEKKKMGEEIPFEDFSSLFGDRVNNIGHVVAIMAPWRQPVYISRVWCIFELFTAYNNVQCNLDIAMPSREKDDMIKSLNSGGLRGIEILFETFAKTDISQAEASEPIDKQRIMDIVTAGPGFDVLNAEVNELLRDWVKDGIMEAVESKFLDKEHQSDADITIEWNESLARLCTNVGNVMFQYAEYEKALKLQRRALKINKSIFGDISLETAASHCNVGSALTAMERNRAALLEYERNHEIHLKILGDEHASTARSHFSKGLVLRKLNKITESLNEHRKALEIQMKTLGKFHSDTAESHNEIGGILKELNLDDKEAMEHYAIALKIREEIYGQEHPDTAQSYHNIGIMLLNQGSRSAGMDNLIKASHIKDKILGKEHPSSILTSAYLQQQKEAEGFIDNDMVTNRFGLDRMASVMSIMDDDSVRSDSESNNQFRLERITSVKFGPRGVD